MNKSVNVVCGAFLVGFAGVVVGGSGRPDGTIAMSAPHLLAIAPGNEVSQAAKELFLATAFGNEFRNELNSIRRWDSPIKIKAHGGNPEDLATLKTVAAELNDLIGHSVALSVVESGANVNIHFAPEPEFKSIAPDYVSGNLGFFWIKWNGDTIDEGTILIESGDRITQKERNHLIREELTQATGLVNDVSGEKWKDSIFQQSWTSVQDYSKEDRQAIALLYSDVIKPGMTLEQVKALLSPTTAAPTSDAAMFQGGSSSLVARTVGSAEGTRSPDGTKNPAYKGHKDPGNGVWNLGTFSYQHGAASPEQADEKQLARLQKQFEQIMQKADGIELSLEEKLNAIDLANQAPLAALEKGGFVDRLKEAREKGLSGEEAIAWARTESFIDPSTGKLNAPGLGNNKDQVLRDQRRRMGEIQKAMSQFDFNSLK